MSQRINDGRVHPSADDRLGSKSRADAEHAKRESDCQNISGSAHDEMARAGIDQQQRLRGGKG
jgi:hypothetical protein